MTLYRVFEALESGRMKLSDPIPVSRHAAGQAPSKLGLKAGQSIKLEDAVLALVTRSANDVAAAVAEAIAGSEYRFALRMTKRARRLGMKRTTFRNASGLPHRKQVTTARDMVTLARAVRRDFPEYYHYFSVKNFSYGGRGHRNHNNLLASYEGTDGIKTGYIGASGYNLVASVQRGPYRLIGVVFGGKSAGSRDVHMKKILDKAFGRVKEDRIRFVAAARAAQAESAVVALNSADSMDWKVQVGAFREFDVAEARARRAVELAPHHLGSAVLAVAPVSGASGTLYRARLMHLSEADAQSACAELAKRDIDCVALGPTSS
jgi:D-alanyl-D-alanine carboxypeptidase